jgi:hypothetical protein
LHRSGNIPSAWDTFRSAIVQAIEQEVRRLDRSAACDSEPLIRRTQPRKLESDDVVAAAAAASSLKQWTPAYRLLRLVLRLRPADERVSSSPPPTSTAAAVTEAAAAGRDGGGGGSDGPEHACRGGGDPAPSRFVKPGEPPSVDRPIPDRNSPERPGAARSGPERPGAIRARLSAACARPPAA